GSLKASDGRERGRSSFSHPTIRSTVVIQALGGSLRRRALRTTPNASTPCRRSTAQLRPGFFGPRAFTGTWPAMRSSSTRLYSTLRLTPRENSPQAMNEEDGSAVKRWLFRAVGVALGLVMAELAARLVLASPTVTRRLHGPH